MGNDVKPLLPIDPSQLPDTDESSEQVEEESREAAFFESERADLSDGLQDRRVQQAFAEKDSQIKKLDEEIKSLRQDRKQRRLFAQRIYWVVVAWLAVLFLVIGASGIKGTIFRFEISEKVLLMLIGSTTANVLGLFGVVLYYLFPKPK